jgi:hypothetical protein
LFFFRFPKPKGRSGSDSSQVNASPLESRSNLFLILSKDSRIKIKKKSVEQTNKNNFMKSTGQEKMLSKLTYSNHVG